MTEEFVLEVLASMIGLLIWEAVFRPGFFPKGSTLSRWIKRRNA